VDVGQWLIENRADMDRAEALWLQRLAEFDRDGLWALDGQFSCASWLVWRTNMARSTADEKLRVAHELERRPIVAEAFRQGRLSYSAARAITRLDRPDPAVDEALIELARSGQGSILDLERVVTCDASTVAHTVTEDGEPLYRPDGRYLGSTHPALARTPVPDIIDSSLSRAPERPGSLMAQQPA
jgi:hypothetical protein